MSAYTIHLRSEDPELLVEFDLPPGTHARIGASPQAEITLPLGGIPPLSFIIGRFHDGRLYLAELDESISRRLDLPALLPLGPYQFELTQPGEDTPPDLTEAAVGGKQPVSKALSLAAVVVVILGAAALLGMNRCGTPGAVHPTLEPVPTKPVPKSSG